MIRLLETLAAVAAMGARSIFSQCAIRNRIFLLFLIVLISFAAPLPLLQAAILYNGDLDPADPNTWTGDTTAYIGKTSDGSVTVNDGSELVSNVGYIGYNTGVTQCRI